MIFFVVYNVSLHCEIKSVETFHNLKHRTVTLIREETIGLTQYEWA